MNYRTAVTFCAGMLATLALVAPRPVAVAQSQGQMNADAGASYEKADADLNRVYKKLLAMEDATGAAKLKKSERAWIVFRDAEMEYAGDEFRGGSAAPLSMYGAGRRLTLARIAELQAYLKQRADR